MARYSNAMTAHVWAQGREQSGQSHNDNMSFASGRLYSYSTVIGLLLPEGRAAYTTSRYSQTTSGKHMPGLHRAIRHMESFGFPALDEIADYLSGYAQYRAGQRSKPAEHVERALWKYLSDYATTLSGESGAYLLGLLNPRRSWSALQAREQALALKNRAASAARIKAALIREGRERAAKPWPVVRATLWSQANSFRQRDLRSDIKEMRAERLAMPKAHKRVRAALWQMETGARAILASAVNDADRHGNPGARTKARAALGKLRRFKAGQIGYVPGYEGPDGAAKLQAALDLPSGAGWRALADMLREIAPLVRAPVSIREAAQALYDKADAIATEREGEERQRQEVKSARSAVLRGLQTFNRGRRFYHQLIDSGAWDGETTDHTGSPMTDRQKVRALDSIVDHVPMETPWGAERGLELSPALAARAKSIAARGAEIAAELEPIRFACLDAVDKAAQLAREAEREEAARIAAMSPDEKRAAWESGELTSYQVRDLERETGPLLRALDAVVDGCRITGGTLETSQGATVPLRHAFAVFAFVRDCRAAGVSWAHERGASDLRFPSPKQIRVGHFQVDSISATGDFTAGCHSIKWGEVERLANRLGVFDCAPVAVDEEASA